MVIHESQFGLNFKDICNLDAHEIKMPIFSIAIHNYIFEQLAT
jgi:hypothetical protein